MFTTKDIRQTRKVVRSGKRDTWKNWSAIMGLKNIKNPLKVSCAGRSVCIVLYYQYSTLCYRSRDRPARRRRSGSSAREDSRSKKRRNDSAERRNRVRERRERDRSSPSSPVKERRERRRSRKESESKVRLD